MKVFLRVVCYVSFLSAVFFTSSLEAPLRRLLSPEIQQDTLTTNNVIDTQQKQQQHENTASYIPPFLHNFYKQLSASNKYFETDPSMSVIKGYFDGECIQIFVYVSFYCVIHLQYLLQSAFVLTFVIILYNFQIIYSCIVRGLKNLGQKFHIEFAHKYVPIILTMDSVH